MEILTLALFLAIPVLTWVSFSYIWPAAARARFIREISALRSDIDDAVIYDELPDVRTTRLLLDRCDFSIENVKELSLSLLLAIHLVHEDHGLEPQVTAPTYGHLNPDQRRMMHEFDLRLINSVRNYVVGSSKLAVPLAAAGLILRSSEALRNRVGTPLPSELAAEYSRSNDPRALTGVGDFTGLQPV